LGGVLAVHASRGLLIHVKDGDESVVQLVGDLDLTTADDLRQAIGALLARNPGDVLLDLQDLRFCDVEGVRALVWSSTRVGEHDHRMRIVGARASIRATLAAVFADELVVVESPEESA
jgi:anti-anti-sigma factor